MCHYIFFIKAFKDLLVAPLAHIFNLSLKSGEYPRLWKISRVAPIPKSGDKCKAENYRPIAILSGFAKLFESLIHNKLYNQLESQLSDEQHAFRKGRSVNTNLLTLVEFISSNMDNRTQVDVLYLDFKKAFDHVDNNVLLQKLSSVGFVPRLLNFFASYLTDRQQFVRLGCYDSSFYHTSSGVSQGSSLGPLLFMIMINDLSSMLTHAKCLIYADDVKLYLPIRETVDCENLQIDINNILNWCSINNLHLNTNKCSIISFTRSFNSISACYNINGHPIARNQTVKDLGVYFDNKLTFHHHIQTLAVECFKRLGFVMRNCKDFTDVHTMKLLYMALIRSKIETSACVWNPHEKLYTLMLEKVQKRFLRTLYRKNYSYPFLYPSKFLMGTLGFNSLETRRLHQQLIMFIQILRGRLNSPELLSGMSRLCVPENRARFRPGRVPLFAPVPARTVARQQSPLFRAQHQLNVFLLEFPDTDLFADGLTALERLCLKFCEKI